MLNHRGQIRETKNLGFLSALISKKMKKGQIGETMTWTVATIVIIIILMASILMASFVFKDKKFVTDPRNDLLIVKSLTGYLSTNNNHVFNQLRDEDNLNGFNGPLAQNIFYFYGKNYDVGWFGISDEVGNSEFTQGRKNKYFEKMPKRNIGTSVSFPYISEKINLEGIRYVEVIFSNEK